MTIGLLRTILAQGATFDWRVWALIVAFVIAALVLAFTVVAVLRVLLVPFSS